MRTCNIVGFAPAHKCVLIMSGLDLSVSCTQVQDLTEHLYTQKSTVTVVTITKTCIYNFDPLKPNLYVVKLGFTEVYILLILLLKNIDCGYSLEPSCRGSSI